MKIGQSLHNKIFQKKKKKALTHKNYRSFEFRHRKTKIRSFRAPINQIIQQNHQSQTDHPKLSLFISSNFFVTKRNKPKQKQKPKSQFTRTIPSNREQIRGKRKSHYLSPRREISYRRRAI